MRILGQIGIVLGVCLAGEGLAMALPFAFPGSIIAMVLLFLLLLTRVVHPRHIQEKASFMLKNMAFFFIPAGVGILENFDLLKSSWLPFLAVCLITTVLTFAATAYTVQGVMALCARRERGRRSC